MVLKRTARIPFRSRVGLLLTAAVLVGLSACGVTRVTGYGEELRANFMQDCIQETFAENTTTSLMALGSEAYCQCVYEAMEDRFSLSFDDLKSYEDELAKAEDDGTAVPDPPEELQKAIDYCSQSGPVPESATTDETSG